MKHPLMILFGVLLLFAAGCNKKAGKYNPEFIGRWQTEVIEDTVAEISYRNEIVIEKKDGSYKYLCQDVCETTLCNCESEQSGTAVVSYPDQQSLKIGNSQPLSIDKEPFEDNGVWKMRINGNLYIKQ